MKTTATCPECGRVFDLLDEGDADEFYNGHDCDCEVISINTTNPLPIGEQQ